MADEIASTLWHDVPEGSEYPSNEKWHAHLLEQYKLYVEMADRISQRRTTGNSYFLSVNSAIFAFIGYLTSKDSTEYLWLLAVAGLLLCILWYQIVTSYRDLNSAKWAVVQMIEARLPISPYAAEWQKVEYGRNPALYRPLSHIERVVPWVFFALHAVVLIKDGPWHDIAAFWLAHFGQTTVLQPMHHFAALIAAALNICCAAFAIAAAVLWYLSATYRASPEQAKTDGPEILIGMKVPLIATLEGQGTRSKWAAGAAAAAAMLQALALLFQVFGV